ALPRDKDGARAGCRRLRSRDRRLPGRRDRRGTGRGDVHPPLRISEGRRRRHDRHQSGHPRRRLLAVCHLLRARSVPRGAADAITDVAQNAHGLRVKRGFGRSIINSFHAIWSIGAVLGGSMASVAIATGLPIGIHLVISAILFGAVSLVALRLCLPGRDDRTEEEAIAGGEEIGGALQRITAKTVIVIVALVLISI